MPRSMSPVLARILSASFILLLASSLMPLAAHAALPGLATSSAGSDDYTEQLVNAAQGGGDVLGGEQGAEPSDPTDLAPLTPQVSNLDRGSVTWLTRLASLFAWLSSSRWFSNPE